MRHVSGAEEKVARTDIAHPVLDPITAGPCGDEIELVTLMRNRGPFVGRAANLTSKSPSTNTSADRSGVRGRASAAASDFGGGVRSIIGFLPSIQLMRRPDFFLGPG